MAPYLKSANPKSQDRKLSLVNICLFMNTVEQLRQHLTCKAEYMEYGNFHQSVPKGYKGEC